MAGRNQFISDSEVRLIPLGEPVIDGAAIFEGSSLDAREVLRSLSPEQRQDISVWTLGHIFTPDEFEAELPGHEHDPLAA